ncbi:hypothetical protein PROFUN_02216 [Planoprotostelium fungivorum]|uniref:C2 domain-containing protein n=1 Tax=Planoprotostelium fungivorum TaxID=1890364 RepID=A0A2P6NZH3_9EUKA|nr:hypothetical protein PROFUN_02216 [Planoprotostelium fungivorum]
MATPTIITPNPTFSDNLGFLRIKVCSGKTIGGKPNFENVYITVSLADTAETPIRRSAQKTKRNHKSTEWNESFDLILDPAATLLRIKATHAGTIRKEKLGSALIPTRDLLHEVETDMTITLFDKNRKQSTGTVFIKYQFFGTKGTEGTRPAVLYTASKKEVARSERRTESLSRVFNVPTNERVIQKYDCALDGKPPTKGVLCLTQHYLFFYSKSTKLSLRLADLEIMEQKATPTGGSVIRVSTVDAKEYIFGNFRRTERVVDQMKRTRTLALADSSITPVVDVSALTGEPDDGPSDTETLLTEPDSSEPDTTDDERIVDRSPIKPVGTVESAPVTPVKGEVIARPVVSVDRLNVHPAAPAGIMTAEISAVLHDIDQRRGNVDHNAKTTVIHPIVTGHSVVQNKAAMRSDVTFPTDDEREINLSPNASTPRYQTPAITSKEVAPDSTKIAHVATPVLPVIAQVANTNTIIASAGQQKVAPAAITASSPVRASKNTDSLLHSISSSEQQLLLIPLLSFACLFSFFIFSSWTRLYNGLLAATAMGTLAAVLQPGGLASLAFDLLVDTTGRKDLQKDELLSTALQIVLTGLICLPLQLVSTGLVGGISLGIFGSLFSCLFIGAASVALESTLGVGEKKHKAL